MITPEDLYTEDFPENNLETVEDNDGIDGNIAEQEGEQAENQTEATTIKPKRIVRNPQPKLNDETLKGPRGLTALPSYFERVKFKGKGNEEQDLNVLLKTYEYWCHRLFPKFPFDDCIAKIEKLGTKRPVQTHIKRIRMDLEVTDAPVIHDNDDNDEQLIYNDEQLIDNDNSFPRLPDLPTVVNISEEQEERVRLNRERARRLREEKWKAIQENSGSQFATNQISQSEQLQSQCTQEMVHSNNENEGIVRDIVETEEKSDENAAEPPNNDQLIDNDNSLSQSSDRPTVVNISEELEERIRLNRERARRLREEKLKAIQGNSGSQLKTNQISQDLFIDHQVSQSETVQSELQQEFVNSSSKTGNEEMLPDVAGTREKYVETVEEPPNNDDDDDDDESIDNILDQINADDDDDGA